MVTERKQWKGLRWGYDEIIVSPFDTTSCQYCLTAPEVEAILAVTEFMTWTTRWESISGLDIDPDEVLRFGNRLRAKLMSCCGDEVILRRVNPETGLMEISVDGGVNWTPDPEDPRIGGVVQPPPVTSGLSGNKCDAANAIQVGYSSMITHLIASKSADASLEQQATEILAVIAAIFGTPLAASLVVIFGAIVNYFLSADATAMSAAFTTETYSQILCILYCHIGENGAFDDSGFASVLADIPTKITDSYAKTATLGLFNKLGKVGLNNWATSRYSNGADCSACDCSTECTDFDNIIVGFGTENSRSSGNTINVTASADGPHYSVRFETDNDNMCCSPRQMKNIVGTASFSFQWIVCGASHTGDWTTIQGFFPSEVIPMNTFLIIGDGPWAADIEWSA